MKTVCVTGTKGKTTVVRALSYVLHRLGETTLRVDTDGHYVNEERCSTLQDARDLFEKAPTVCPGKYLLSMKEFFPDFTAVLEASVGSNGIHGLGYSFHSTGVFTNVFEDHIGFGSLRTRDDLARAKSFVFSRIREGGYAVFNADDRFVCVQLGRRKGKDITLLPVGIRFDSFDLERHLRDGGAAVTENGGWIVWKTSEDERKIIRTRDVSWTFQGLFMPSVYNLMFIVATLASLGIDIFSKKVHDAVTGYELDREGGRLTVFKNGNGVTIILDFAHEKVSLVEIARLGNRLKTNRLIGVVRLAPDRTDEMITDTGRHIANEFDDIIVYDKIDGVTSKRYVGKNVNLTREAGEVSGIFLKGILESKTSGLAERIVEEPEAIRKAAQTAKPGDVVVVICGDNKKRTVSLIKECFSAEYDSI